MAYIYKIENQINHKVYIGKTEYEPERRWNEHKAEAKRNRSLNRALYRAMRKYGIENFSFEVIKETNNPNNDEMQSIIDYDSFHNGYNETLGGDGCSYLELSELEICKSYLEKRNIRAVADEFKHDYLTIRKILYKNNIPIDRFSNLRKSVAKLDKDTEEIIAVYPSISEAERQNKTTNHHVGAVCSGKRKTAGGYKWKFCSDIYAE